MSTTAYSLGEKYIVGLDFLDDDTVVAGHSQGRLIIAPFGMAINPPGIRLGDGTACKWPYSLLCGYIPTLIFLK